VNEDVTGKERQLQLFAAVFPPAQATVERQKTIDPAVLYLLLNSLFVARPGVGYVPVEIMLFVRTGKRRRTTQILAAIQFEASRKSLDRLGYSFALSATSAKFVKLSSSNCLRLSGGFSL
jgi:hypothetical protein